MEGHAERGDRIGEEVFQHAARPGEVAAVRAAGTRVFSFDATAIAEAHGERRMGNTVMLGAIADHLPFPAEILEQCVLKRFARKGEEIVEKNRRAFAAGRAASAQAASAHA